MLVGVLGFLVSYKDEVFHLEDALKTSGHKWWSRHLGVGAAFLTLMCSLILAVASAVVA